MQKVTFQPPRFAQWILRRTLERKDRDFILGDFDEFYTEKRNINGKMKADLWYWGQCYKSIPHFIRNTMYWQSIMTANYLKVGLRSIRRYRSFSLINIIGLAVALSSCILILLWVSDEMSYDRFHVQADSIYRIESDQILPGRRIHTPSTPPPLATVLADEIPEVIRATHCTRFGGMHIRYGEHVYFEDRIHAVDPSFFEMFSFPLIQGSKEGVFEDPFGIVLTQSTADKLFGKENPLGKTVTVENQWEMTVTGVVQNPPRNSTIQFTGLVRYEFTRDQLERMPDGWVNAISSFVQIRPDADPKTVGPKISELVLRHNDKVKCEYTLQPLKRLRLHSSFGPNPGMGLIRYMYIFSSVAIFVLIIASINFVNLSTARSFTRAKEIGIRKVVGAQRTDVIRQFFSESIVLTFLSTVLALLIVVLMLPVFNNLSWKQLNIGYLFQGKIILMILSMSLATGILSGVYPAVALSLFRPVQILSGVSKNRSGRFAFRKGLVVLQFVISIFLIIGTRVIYRQVTYMQETDLGFNTKEVIAIRMTGETPLSYAVLKQELLKHQDILKVSSSGRRPLVNTDHGHNINWDGKDPSQQVSVVFHTIDFDYLELMEHEIVDGRGYSPDFSTDSSGVFVINESLARLIDEDSAVGKSFQIFWMKGHVIGVVKDFHHTPLMHSIEPLVMLMAPNPYWKSNLLLKVNPERIPETIKFIESTWKEIVPAFPFEYSFLSEEQGRLYRIERRLGNLLNYFTILAVFIACLGLLGLAAFAAIQRTKEIGIRKVLGATDFRLICMLSKELLQWVIVANIVAWPLAWFVMNNWLNGFAYKSRLGVDIFLMAGILAGLIAFVTVGLQALRSARANPVDTLRYE